VLLDDAEGDREPEPGADADRLGGEKGIEDAVQVSARDAAAVVVNRQFDAALQRAAAHVDLSGFTDRLASVDEQVQEQLLEALGLALDRRQSSAGDRDVDAARRLQPSHPGRLLDQVRQVRDTALAATGMRELAYVAHDGSGAIHALERVVHDLLGLGQHRYERGPVGPDALAQRIDVFAEHGQVRAHVGDRVVEFVGDARGQFAHGGHAARGEQATA
jgi:hypothetical protein